MNKMLQRHPCRALPLSCLMATTLAMNAALAALPAEVSAALSMAGVPESAVSVWVAPADGTAPPRLTQGAQTPRQMASVMKLFTTGVALQKLGPAYTWRTDIALDGALRPDGMLQGNLLMRGDGDPTLVTERLMLLMSRLRQAGLRTIRGNWLLDRTAFQLDPHDPAAFDGEPLKPHNAGPDALLISHGAVLLRLRPDAAHPGLAQVSMEPVLADVTLAARVRLDPTAACGDWRAHLQLDAQPQAGSGTPARWRISLNGSYPSACEEKEWPLLWPEANPNRHTERAIQASWAQAGGRLQGEVQPGIWPDGLRPWLSWVSPPLFQAVQDINKFSNNVMAQQLFLTLGRTAPQPDKPVPGPTSLASARQVVASWVDQATATTSQSAHPCSAASLGLDNGSGLSRTSFASAECVGTWLQRLWTSPVMPELVASLPITGVDGTARRFTETTGLGHIKTGSLDGVIAVAGIIQTVSGRRDVVVAVVNDPKADLARPALRTLLKWAADNP